MALSGMVLCAGLGTRLRPLTNVLPKPACPVLHQPLVAYNLALLKGAGVTRAVINTHHLAEPMARAARQAAAGLGLELAVSHEPTLLGTGGGLKAAEAWLKGDTFLLLNGDFLYDVDLDRALAAHRAAGAAATLVVQPMPPGGDYRPLHADAGGRLAVLPGAAPPAGALPWHFTGVHLLEPAIFEGLELRPSGLFETGYRSLLARGLRVRVHVDAGRWLDLGEPRHYLAANLDAAFGRFPLGRFSALGRARPVSTEARIEGQADESVIGAGARIPLGARVRRSVVLPGTELVDEALDGVIAAGELRIPG